MPSPSPEEPREIWLDDSTDACPPYHLYPGKPTPEALAAARQLVAERGLAPARPPAARRRK